MKWGIREAGELEGWGLKVRSAEQYPICYKTRIYLSWGFLNGMLMRVNNLLRVININRIELSAVRP